MDFQDQVRRHKELSLQIEELEKEKKALGMTIMDQMQGKTARVSDYLVKRMQRLSISTTIEDARQLNATKMEEAVDKDKIKSLYQQGHPVQGVSEVHYIQISMVPSNRNSPFDDLPG